MARLFDDAASEYLENTTGTPVSGVPLTMAAWFYCDDVVTWTSRTLIAIQDKDSGDDWIRLYIRAGDANEARAGARSSLGHDHAAATTTYSGNAWHHAGAVFTTTTSRAAYLDGRAKGTNATAITPLALDSVSVGRIGDSSPGEYMSGRIAEAVVLRIAATDYQVWLHAQGVPAPIVWPGWAIAAYYPLFEVDRDFPLGRYNMTPFNTPSWAPHPPKVLAWYRKHMRGSTT